MSVQNDTIRLSVGLSLTKKDRKRLSAFLSATGRKIGPYLTILAMREVETWEAISQGKTQVDPAALQ